MCGKIAENCACDEQWCTIHIDNQSSTLISLCFHVRYLQQHDTNTASTHSDTITQMVTYHANQSNHKHQQDAHNVRISMYEPTCSYEMTMCHVLHVPGSWTFSPKLTGWF